MSDDVLTPFIETHGDVFLQHVLPRVNAAPRACACGREDAVPASFVGNLVLRAVSRAFRTLIPTYRDAVRTVAAREAAQDAVVGMVPKAALRRVGLLTFTSGSLRRWFEKTRRRRDARDGDATLRASLDEVAKFMRRRDNAEESDEDSDDSLRDEPCCGVCWADVKHTLACVCCSRRCVCGSLTVCDECYDFGKERGYHLHLNPLYMCAECLRIECDICPESGDFCYCQTCQKVVCASCGMAECDWCEESACRSCVESRALESGGARIKCHCCDTMACMRCIDGEWFTLSGCAQLQQRRAHDDRIAQVLVCPGCVDDPRKFVICECCDFRACTECAGDLGFRQSSGDSPMTCCASCLQRLEMFDPLHTLSLSNRRFVVETIRTLRGLREPNV